MTGRVHTMPDGRTWVHQGWKPYLRKSDGRTVEVQVWQSWCAVCLDEIEVLTSKTNPSEASALRLMHCKAHRLSATGWVTKAGAER